MVSSENNSVNYTLSDAFQTLAIPFPFQANNTIYVYKGADGAITLTQGVDYSILGAGLESGGSITLTGTATDAGDFLTILRDVPITQLTDYIANDRFPAEVHERALDKLTMIAQQHERELQGAFRIPAYEGTVSPITRAQRAGKLFNFDDTGAPIFNWTVAEIIAAAQNVSGDGAPLSVSFVSALISLPVLGVPSGTPCALLGYYTPNDGGGGVLYYDSSSTATVENMLVFATSSGVGRWMRLTEDTITPLMIGCMPNSGLDETARFQAAWNIAGASGLARGRNARFYVPPGRYEVTNLVDPGYTEVFGNWMNINAGVVGGTAIIVRRPGATGFTITVSTTHPSNIHDLTMLGYSDRDSALTSKLITANAANRTTFTVATGDVPAAPALPLSYPYFGVCLFYSPENLCLGSGVVQFVNAGTGLITLMTGSDTYATVNPSDYLTTGCRVIFSPNITETNPSNGISVTGPDAMSIGIGGFNYKGRGYANLERILFYGYHVGVRFGAGVTGTRVDNIHAMNVRVAGIGSAVTGASNSDQWIGHVILGGPYYADHDNAVPETLTIKNPAYRRGVCGIWSPGAAWQIQDLVCYSHIWSIHAVKTQRTMVGVAYLDDNVCGGLYFADGVVTSAPPGFSFCMLVNQPLFQVSELPTFTKLLAGVKLFGQNARVSIGHFRNAVTGGTPNRYAYDVDIANEETTWLEITGKSVCPGGIAQFNGAGKRYADRMLSYTGASQMLVKRTDADGHEELWDRIGAAQDARMTRTGNSIDCVLSSDGTTPVGLEIQLSGGLTAFGGGIRSRNPSSGIGYSTGAGGTVTQATSKTTGVSLNRASGEIVMNGAALNAGVTVSFQLTNTAIAVNDVVALVIKSAATAGAYDCVVDNVANGNCRISVTNRSGGNLSEAIVLGFVLIKAVIA